MGDAEFEFWPLRQLKGVDFVREVRRRLVHERRTFDVLQCEVLTPLEAFLSFLLLGSWCRKRVLVLHDRYFHQGVRSVLRRIPSFLLLGLDLMLYDRIIVPGDGLKRFFTRLYGSVISHKFSTVPNGAPVERVVRKNQQDRSRYGIPDSHCAVLFFGNLNYGPNLEAANYLTRWSELICQSFEKSTGRPLKIVIAGRGSENLRPSKGVIPLGFVDDLNDLLSRVDIAMLPHPASHSGPHVKTLYCLAGGLPIVTTSDGMKDMPGLQPGRECLLFELDDPSSAARAAARITIDGELRSGLIRHGLEYSSNWPWSRVAKKQRRVYEALFR